MVCVPKADFSLLARLQALYRHCKATEDLDVKFTDFITHRPNNIDCISDRHLPDDNQKPRQPFSFHHHQHAKTFIHAALQMDIAMPVVQLNNFKLPKIKPFIQVISLTFFIRPIHTNSTRLHYSFKLTVGYQW